jgi:peptidoglycan/LPS O-acetylase OafA/YrhL
MSFLLSQLIEASRWLGALVVLWLHANNIFVNQADIMSAPHAPPVYAWWFFSAFELGHQAVLGFFVMSGWLVGGAVLAAIRGGQDFLRDYFIHRFSRIYLVLIPALFLTLALDLLGGRLFSASGVYDWPMFVDHWSPTLFFATFVNLQSIGFAVFGTNGPLWSLACEFWYYVTFPLLLLPWARRYAAPLRFGGFALGVALFVALSTPPSFFKFGYLVWAMGAFATLATRPLVRSRWLALGLYALVVILIRLLVRGPNLAAHPWLAPVSDFVGSALFVVVLLSFRHGAHEGFGLLRLKLHKTLADFSFSLYSIHLPILILVRAGVGAILGRDFATRLATPANYGVCFAAMAAAVVAAYGFSRVTETKTGAARRALRRLLEKAAPAAATEPAPQRATTGS